MKKALKHKLEIIEDIKVRAADDAAVRKLLAICFPGDAAFFLKSRVWHSAPECILIRRSGREIKGHVAIIIRAVRCGRVKINIAGIQSLAVNPECRGTGLAQALMTESMAEAWRRKIEFGLLFCVPALERFYASLGWRRIDAPVCMRDETGGKAPLPSKNICMVLALSGKAFPEGAIDLLGRDW